MVIVYRIKKMTAGILSACMVISVLAGLPVSKGVVKAAEQNGKSVTEIHNIIYMIPDGGGYPSYDIAKAVKAVGGLTYRNGSDGTAITSKDMHMDPYLVASVTMKSNDNGTTDLAAVGMVLSTGYKTNNSYG